jgi:hypothetical protein
MNSGATPNPEPPTSESTIHRTVNPPNRLLADWRISVLVLIALWAVIYMAGLSRPALLDDADTVHAEAAREMLQRHDWVTLYVNGIRYLEKAPLMYWGVATSYTLFGISEWSTRFPLMLVVLAMILSTYGLGRWALGSEAFSGVAGTTEAGASEAGALDLLGTRRRVRAQRAHQGIDRTGVSGGSDRALSAADWEFAALAEAASVFERAGVSRDRCAVAHSGRAAKSGAGPRARISLVLLRQ